MKMITHLAKLVRPLNNRVKSVVNFGDLFASGNVFVRYTSQMPMMQLPDKLITKRRPELSLKYDPQTRKLTLQMGDKKLESSSNQADNKDSQFCSYCNAPRCKLLSGSAKSGDNNELAKANPNTITISIDRDDFCRAICNSSASGSPTGKTDDDADSDDGYCPTCKASTCKFLKKPVDNLKSTEESSEYCDECKAPKCKLVEKLESPGKRDVDVRTETPNKLNKGSESCEYCDKENNENVRKGSPTKRNKYSDIDEGTEKDKKRSDDITKSPKYCPACKLPECKYEKSKSIQTGTEVGKKTGAYESSDKINITVNAADFCGVICKGVEISKNASIKSNKLRDKSSKSKNFISNYDNDNSKI